MYIRIKYKQTSHHYEVIYFSSPLIHQGVVVPYASNCTLVLPRYHKPSELVPLFFWLVMHVMILKRKTSHECQD